MHPQALQKEVAIMAGLRHPAVVQFLGVSLQPPMLVTEYCERGSLFSVVYNMRFAAPETISSTFDWRRRLSLALDASLGMEFLVGRCCWLPCMLCVDSVMRVLIQILM